MKKKLALLAVPVLMMFLVTSFAWADAGDRIFRFGLKWVSPTGDLSTAQSGSLRFEDVTEPGWIDITITGNFEPDSTIGYVIGFEYLFTDLVGIDFNVDYSKHDVESTIGGSALFTPDDPPPSPETVSIFGRQNGDIAIYPITVGVNFHLSRSDVVDFYLGPFVGYVFYDDLEFDEGIMGFDFSSIGPFELILSAESVSIKDDFTYGAVAGVDVPFGGEGWMFSGALKYFITSAEIDEVGVDEELDVDPWEIFVGLGYKW